jgi:DNA polymerase III alpha subunit (gram-positive type)
MSQYYLLWDTETGGLDPKKTDLLTAYFAIVDEQFNVIDQIDLKLKPDSRLPITEAQALKVNGININQHLENPETITYSEGKQKLITLIRKYLKKTGRFSNIRPMGYNCPFDVNFTQTHLLPKEEWDSLLHYKHVDVMQYVDFLKICSWFPSELGSLGTVVEYLQIPKRAAHNAKEDSLMTLDVFKKILDIMKSKKDGGSGAQQDLISLLEAE